MEARYVMSVRISTTLKIVVAVLFIFQHRTVNAQLRVNPKQDTKPCPEIPRSPFRYAITSNDVREFSRYQTGPMVKSRGVAVLLEGKSFTEENLKQLFGLLSRRFPEPVELTVSVYTDLEDILTPEENDVIWINCTLDLAKLTPEHPWAFYMRDSESERFTYHTKKPDEPPKNVVLRGRP